MEFIFFQEETFGYVFVAANDRQGHKNNAAHERQQFQPLTCCSLSHAGCLLRSGDFKTECYVLFLHKYVVFTFPMSSFIPFCLRSLVTLINFQRTQ